jgi:hypothetical protein
VQFVWRAALERLAVAVACGLIELVPLEISVLSLRAGVVFSLVLDVVIGPGHIVAVLAFRLFVVLYFALLLLCAKAARDELHRIFTKKRLRCACTIDPPAVAGAVWP